MTAVPGRGGVRDLGNKNVLASRLGTVPETFSRTLKKLQEEGIIRIRGNQIRILKADAFVGALALYHSIGTRPGGYPLQSFNSPM